MKRRLPTKILSIVAGLGLFCHATGTGAQVPLATEGEQAVTDDGLHRVLPSIMEAAWVAPDFDLSAYRRILLMPTGVLFRDVPERGDNARSRAATEEFLLSDDRKEWFRELWSQAVEARFPENEPLDNYRTDASDVLVVQGFLVDVVSRISPAGSGSSYSVISNPWSVVIVLELRDAVTAQLLARTLDKRNPRGLMEVGAVWQQTDELAEGWAGVLTERLDQLSELGGRPRAPPYWWAPDQ